MALIGTYGGLIRASGGIVKAGCCCCPPGQNPHANFSYEHTSGTSCIIDLFDLTAIHVNCAGTIVAWRWLKNGVEFSTDQNPTGISVAEGDEITLIATDSCGCSDSAVGEIECGVLCGDTLFPNSVNVSISGLTRVSGCLDCSIFNGLHNLPRVGGTSMSSCICSGSLMADCICTASYVKTVSTCFGNVNISVDLSRNKCLNQYGISVSINALNGTLFNKLNIPAPFNFLSFSYSSLTNNSQINSCSPPAGGPFTVTVSS